MNFDVLLKGHRARMDSGFWNFDIAHHVWFTWV